MVNIKIDSSEDTEFIHMHMLDVSLLKLILVIYSD